MHSAGSTPLLCELFVLHSCYFDYSTDAYISIDTHLSILLKLLHKIVTQWSEYLLYGGLGGVVESPSPFLTNSLFFGFLQKNVHSTRFVTYFCEQVLPNLSSLTTPVEGLDIQLEVREKYLLLVRKGILMF